MYRDSSSNSSFNKYVNSKVTFRFLSHEKRKTTLMTLIKSETILKTNFQRSKTSVWKKYV